MRKDVFSNNPLKTLIINSGVIGDKAFSDYRSLSSLTIKNGVTSIGNLAFYKNNLTSIVIPNSVSHIGTFAFAENKLTFVSISNGIRNIENGAFFQNQITSLVIPDSITTIGQGAFFANPITSITFKGIIPPLSKERDVFDKNIMVIYVPANAIESYKKALPKYSDKIQRIP